VSFGGAYALLAYMAQQAVETHHWMKRAEMVDGLGLARPPPDRSFLVTQIRRIPRRLSRPCAVLPLWVQASRGGRHYLGDVLAADDADLRGAPFVEKLRSNQRLSERWQHTAAVSA